MKTLTEITADAKQSLRVVLETNQTMILTLEYIDNQQGWYYGITYNAFLLQGQRLVTSPNFLAKYKNVLPFGIGCITADNYEPIYINDFVSSDGIQQPRAYMIVLGATDIQTVGV